MTVNTAASFIRDTDASWTASQFTKATEGLTAALLGPEHFLSPDQLNSPEFTA